MYRRRPYSVWRLRFAVRFRPLCLFVPFLSVFPLTGSCLPRGRRGRFFSLAVLPLGSVYRRTAFGSKKTAPAIAGAVLLFKRSLQLGSGCGGGQQDVAEDKQCGQDVHQYGHFLGFAAGQLDEGVGDDTEADAIRD